MRVRARGERGDHAREGGDQDEVKGVALVEHCPPGPGDYSSGGGVSNPPLSWEHWIERYSDRGHQVLAPAWPGLDGEPEELRRDPSPLRGLGITDVVDHYEKIIRGLDRPPIIIGHSFGGLFTQLLLDRGLGAAGVALGTAAPKGVLKLPLLDPQGGLAGAAAIRRT